MFFDENAFVKNYSAEQNESAAKNPDVQSIHSQNENSQTVNAAATKVLYPQSYNVGTGHYDIPELPPKQEAMPQQSGFNLGSLFPMLSNLFGGLGGGGGSGGLGGLGGLLKNIDLSKILGMLGGLSAGSDKTQAQTEGGSGIDGILKNLSGTNSAGIEGILKNLGGDSPLGSLLKGVSGNGILETLLKSFTSNKKTVNFKEKTSSPANSKSIDDYERVDDEIVIEEAKKINL